MTPNLQRHVLRWQTVCITNVSIRTIVINLFLVGIQSEKYAITQLVQDLGPLLTNTTIADREKGTLILSLVLTHLPNNILNSTQLNFICNFYSERLNDHHQVKKFKIWLMLLCYNEYLHFVGGTCCFKGPNSNS